MMELSKTRIYDIQLVIDQIRVNNQIAKVLCVECCGSRMFLGTAEGFLLEYFITDEKSKTFFSRVREVNLNKGQPVVQIRNASAFDTLIVLTGATLAMFDSQSLEVVRNNISSVTTFSVDENPVDGDPFSLSVCFAKRKSIYLATASEKGFAVGREISLDAPTVALAIEGGLCCAALANGKYVFVDTLAQRKAVQEIISFDPNEVLPKVVYVGKEEFLVIGPGGLGVFSTSKGTSERAPIIWAEKVTQLAVDSLNVVAVGGDSIYVSSLSDPGNSNLITFPSAKVLSVSEGRLYVATGRSLYRFLPISIENQIESLLASGKIDQAFSLLEIASVVSSTKLILLQKVHKRAVFKRLEDGDFDSCRISIRESSIDIREVISLFPSILPLSTTFTRSLPQLHEFTDIDQMLGSDKVQVKSVGCFLLDEIMSTDYILSKDLSTSAIKLAAEFNKEAFNLLTNNFSALNIDFEDCLEWLMEKKFLNCAALLHKANGELSKALSVWYQLLQKEVRCEPPDSFGGVDVMVDSLLRCNDDDIVWEYFYKISKFDEDKGLEIFTRRDSSPFFQPLDIAEKMSKSSKLSARKYLMHCVNIRKLDDEDLHTFLCTLFIEEITNSPNTENLRSDFRNFLLDSNSLKVQFLIGKLSNTPLRLELAIIHGKAGNHELALKVIVEELQDYQLAREYCKRVSDKTERQNAYVTLTKIYISHQRPSDELEKQYIGPECLAVLGDFIEEFDISVLLPYFQDDVPLSVLSKVLVRAFRVKLHQERTSKVLKSLSGRVNDDCIVNFHIKNQGYQLDDDSVCGVCWRKFDPLEPVLYKKGLVVHSKCV